jgi:hypothetical protein
MKLTFLEIPKFPNVASLWRLLAETRRQRRRCSSLFSGLEFASTYGINNKSDLKKLIDWLKEHEKSLENLLTQAGQIV